MQLKSISFNFFIFFVFNLVLVGGIQAEVDEESSYVDLGETVITARALPESIKKTAHTIEVIEGEEIRNRTDRSVAEAIREIPGVRVQSLGTRGESSSIRIRGASNDEALVLLDGVRINDPFDGDTNLGLFPVELIDRIEVLRGSQAVLYGGRAIGGVVNIITKKGSDEDEFRLSFEAGNLGHLRELLTWRGSTKGKRLFYSFGLSRTDDEGLFLNDRYGQTAITQRWDILPTDKLNMTLSSHIFLDNKQLARGFLIGPAVLYDPNLPEDGIFIQIYRDYNRKVKELTMAHSLKLDYEWNEMFKTQFIYGFFYNDVEERDSNQGEGGFLTPSGVLLAPNSVKNRIKSYRHDFDLRQFVFLPEMGNFKQSLTVGFEFQDERISAMGETPLSGDSPFFLPNALGPFIPAVDTIPSEEIPGDRQNYSPYLQYHLEYAERLIFDAGIRWDYNSAYGSELSPRIAIAVLLPEIDGKIHGAYGEGFLPPTNLQLFNPISGNPDLKPQTSQSYEVGYEQYIGDKAMLYATYFYLDFDNLIDRLGTQSADAFSMGIEAGFRYQPIEPLKISANYTWTHSKDESGTGQRLEGIPTHSLNAMLSANPWKSLQIDSSLSWVSSQRESFPILSDDGRAVGGTLLETLNGGENPGYVLWDLGVSYTFDLTSQTQSHPQSIRVYGKANNILNTDYEGRFGFPAPKFHFLAGGEVLF